MRQWIVLIAMCCSLVPAVVRAQAEIDCKSAKRPPVDMKTYHEICNARAAAERAASASGRATLAAAAATVRNSRKTVAGLSFANVPTWSNADILAQFAATRDKRYMTTSSAPSFQRRIAWLFPEDGCYARAEQVNAQIAQAGKVKPHKLFAFGDYLRAEGLRFNTDNSFEGFVEWGWHVVPVVKNSAGEPIVFDAALSPCRPLPWKEWLALMVNDLSQLDNLDAGWGVALGDANAYNPDSFVTGEPSHAAESLSWFKDGIINPLVVEWDNQWGLGRDPNVVLGANPPWSGYACVNTRETPLVSATVAPNATQTLTATCPFGTLATGGGISAPQGFLVTRNSKSSGNGWTITARNNTSASAPLDVRAVCLTGAPTTASVTTVTGSTSSVSANLSGSASASCASGTLVGGGYSTTGTTSIMRVYSNKRSTSTGSTWQVSAQNTTTSSKSITAYAYCLANTRFTFNQVAGSAAYNGGFSIATCTPKKMLGGGYAFPRTSAYHVDFTANFGPEIYLVSMAGSPASGDPNALGYAECLAHP
jgi:Glutaminase